MGVSAEVARRTFVAAVVAALPLVVGAQDAQPIASTVSAQPAEQSWQVTTAADEATASAPAPTPPQTVPAPRPPSFTRLPPEYAPPPQRVVAQPVPAAPVPVPAQLPPPRAAPPPQRRPVYLAFALGGGDGSLRLAAPGLPARTVSIHDFFGKGPFTFAFDVEIGATLTPRLLLGGELTSFGAAAAYKRPAGDETLALGISNLDAVSTFFPFERGLFLKAGLGLSRLATQRKPPHAATESRSAIGGNVALGAGYAFWIGERFNLSLNLDWSGQAYRDDEFERSSFWRAGLGFAWY